MRKTKRPSIAAWYRHRIVRKIRPAHLRIGEYSHIRPAECPTWPIDHLFKNGSLNLEGASPLLFLEGNMVGVITSWDVLAHPITTVQCFGWLIFFRAAVPWHDVPFLSLVRDAGLFRAPPSNVPRILDRCIDLELRAKRIYNALAKALFDQGPVGPFFADLAEQEQQHSDLLEVVRSAAMRSGWNASLFNPWEDYLPRLERQMDAAEAAVREIDSVDAALQIVIEIESSEVNKVFNAILAATEADFVKKLRPFRRAMEAHMAYIAERIPQLSPRMLTKVRELRASFPQLRA
jgi:hypothetical protein